MKLIGMLDSPYVRRTAIGMKLLGLEFEHHSISVFSTYEQFRQINSVVKAPTLVLDDGQVLMDSSLILDYLAPLSANGHVLIPAEPARRLQAYRLLGLALAACEKSVQIVYEDKRPQDKRHAPWVERVAQQLLAACTELEREVAELPIPGSEAALGLAELTIAVAWSFTQLLLPQHAPAQRFPALAAYTAALEALPVFVDTPPV
ncbi:glutathione S-transferase N-terminal domain-containing protein [Oxalobacteraceae bacterium A2-2]